MTNYVVRRIASGTTHVLDVTETYRLSHWGAVYHAPNEGTAVCGVSIVDGVVMQAGTKVKCRPCAHLSGIKVQPDDAPWDPS